MTESQPDAPESFGSTKESALITWGQLVRLPNTFTVLADVGAAYLVAGQGPEPTLRLVIVLAAGVLLYWAGMVLNDVFDVDEDREHRPGRPVAAGKVSLSTAKLAGYGMLLAGIAGAAISGFVHTQTLPATWLPLIVAICLALAVVLYDGPLKSTLFAPATMGVCRVLSFLLGAAPHFALSSGFPPWIITFAVGMGMYVMGVTLIGRREAVGDRSPNLLTGAIITAIAGAIIAYAPQLAPRDHAWFFSPGPPFGLLITMIIAPVVLRGWRAWQAPSPATVQTAVRIGVLTIIPLSAAIAFLGAGAFWGLLIFAGVVPSLALSQTFRVT